MQLLQVDLASGVWVVRNRFDPGTTVQTHKHRPRVRLHHHRELEHLESPRH